MRLHEDPVVDQARHGLRNYLFDYYEGRESVGSSTIRALGHAARLLKARAEYAGFDGQPLTLAGVYAAQTLAVVEGQIADARVSAPLAYAHAFEGQSRENPDAPGNDSFVGVYFREYDTHAEPDATRDQRIAGAMTWLVEDIESLNVAIDSARVHQAIANLGAQS